MKTWCFTHYKVLIDDAADALLPLSQGQVRVAEEGQLLLQTAHTKGQVARWQDEEDDAEERGGDRRVHRVQKLGDYYDISLLL